MSINKQFVEDNHNLILYLADRLGKRLSDEGKADLAHNVVVKILEAKEEARQDQSSAYVTRVMKNCLLNEIRDDRVDAIAHADSLDQPVYEDDGEMYTLHACVEGGVEEKSPYMLYKKDIEDLCKNLPPTQRTMFRMRYHLGLTPTEIAKELRVTNKYVRNQLHLAVRIAYELAEEDKVK